MADISSKRLVLALDGMGGDNAPHCVVDGAALALKTYPDVEFIIYGDEAQLAPLISAHDDLRKVSKIVHTDEVVANDDKPAFALRRKRNSSMSLAIKAVRNGDAVGAVSAGNTGALMAMSKVMLRTLPGIERPAIGGVVPTKKGSAVMLDLGANVNCDAYNLFEFAVMGDAFARTILNLSSPSIGLLNIGHEEAKGNEAVKAAATMLRESDLSLNFYGHVEGHDIGLGTVDVIVTDGFTGNVALKTLEGSAKMFSARLKKAFSKSLLAKLGYLFVRPVMHAFKDDLNPSLYNGAMLLGLNGVVVKSHGSMKAVGLASAIEVTARLAKDNINKHIVDEMIQSGHIEAEDGDLDITDFEG